MPRVRRLPAGEGAASTYLQRNPKFAGRISPSTRDPFGARGIPLEVGTLSRPSENFGERTAL